ncbi:MAG: SpoIIE family protein phosphatase [Armatimonadota bacterium]|nr:SpoIIE family protein phosphatase [Armatimonadota bacterium]
MAPEAPTEPKQAEETLRQSEARFRALFESSRDAIGVSLGGTHIFVNPAYAAMYGFADSADLVGTSIMACIAPSDRAPIQQRIQRRAQGIPEPDTYEVRGLRRDGAEFDLENRVTHYDWQGQTYTLVIQRDITARKQAEATLQESEIRFRALADNIAQLAWIADADGSISWYNQRWLDYTGTTLEELQGWDWQKIHHPDHVDRVTEKYSEHVRLGQFWEDTFPLRGKDGHYRWFLSRAFPIRDEQGNIVLWCGTNTDITDQREAEAKLAAAFRREMMINQIGQAIRQTRDPDTIQSTAVQALGEALSADRAYFTILDSTHDAFLVSHDFHRADLTPLTGAYRISDFQQDPATLYPGGKTRVLPDVQAWDWPAPLADAIHAMHVRASISVPLFDKSTLVGALAVAMTDGPRAWTDDEIALVESVAAQTRAALDAAGIQAREHRIAEQLQRALQPALPEHVPGLSIGKYTRPALDEAAVGGDFFDVFPLNSERCALVIGDVSGKGLAAAQQLALIRNSLRTTLYLSQTPALAATSLNTIVTTHDLLAGFVTVFVGIYDITSGQIAYASCGHEPGLIRRAFGGAINTLPPTGPPLGVYERAVYEEATVTLCPGDTLLLYTDGISEAGPNRRELLGADGLTRLFSALPFPLDVQAQAEFLVSQVRAEANGTFHDDIAVLLFRRTSEEQPYQSQTEG